MTMKTISRRTLLKVAPLGLVALATVSPNAVAAAVDPAIAALGNIRKAKRASDLAYMRLDAAEARAVIDLGPRPWRMIAWGRYSAIGGSELAGASDYYLSIGVDPERVKTEFAAAKRRLRSAAIAGRAWDRKAGTVELRRANEVAKHDFRRSLWIAARTVPTTTQGAACMAAWLGVELGEFCERYHRIAAKNLARGLRVLGKVQL